MPTEDILNRSNFGLLPEAEFRWASFGAATITNLCIGAAVILIGMIQIHKQVELKHLQQTQLVFSDPPPIIKPPVIPKVKVLAPAPVEMAKLAPPKIAVPKIEIPKPVEMPKPVKMDVPAPALPPPPPKAVAPAPQAKLANFASNNPTPVANNTVAPTAHAGGFGNPVGVTANPNANKTATIAAAGFSNAAPGAGAPGAGAARLGSAKSTNAFGSGVANGVPGGQSKGTVASAGFSNGSIGGKPGGVVGGTVSSGNFGGPQYGGGGVAPVLAKTESSMTPPEVTSEPKPRYSPEARAARVQGDVTLRVIFKATGEVVVLSVTQGLGHGLDEEAKRVAEQIRFKPAMKNGQAVDHTTLIHITFQLA